MRLYHIFAVATVLALSARAVVFWPDQPQPSPHWTDPEPTQEQKTAYSGTGNHIRDLCIYQDGCPDGLVCKEGSCVPKPAMQLTILSSATAGITIPTLSTRPKATITIPTLWMDHSPLFPSSAPATVVTTATATVTAQPASPSATSPNYKHVLAYIAIPVALLCAAVAAFAWWQRRRQARTNVSTEEALPAVSAINGIRGSAGLGTNSGVWTGKGHREYRSSAASSVPTARRGQKVSGRESGTEAGRVSAWPEK